MPADTHTTQVLLAELISHPTVSRDGTESLAQYVAAYLDGAVDDCQVLPTDRPGHVNVLARVGPACDDRKGLLLSGHLDVVPADEADWNSPPFEPRLEDDCMFGRGACDMKAAVAVFMNVLHAAHKAELDRPLWLLLSCDEEVGSLGVQHFIERHADAFHLPQQAVVGEPTSLRAVRMHKGHMKLRVRFAGMSAHSGTPHLGQNAIDACAAATCRLREVNQVWQSQGGAHGKHFADVPHPVLNVVGIRGGNAWNVVPDQCEIDIGVRVLPGMESDVILDQVRRACVGSPGTGVDAGACDLELVQDNPPLLTDDTASIYRAICQRVQQSESVGVSFASDGGMLKRDLRIDCVLFGPGDMSVAHKSNEYVSLSEVHRYEAHIIQLVKQFCMAHGETIDV